MDPAVKPAAGSGGLFTQIAVVGNARLVAGVNATFSGDSKHFSAIQDLAAKVPLSKLAKEYRASTLMEQLAKSPLHIAYFFCHAGKTKDGAGCVVLQGPQAKQADVFVWSEFGDLLNGESRWTPPAPVFLKLPDGNYRPEALGRPCCEDVACCWRKGIRWVSFTLSTAPRRWCSTPSVPIA